jgi:NurA domain
MLEREPDNAFRQTQQTLSSFLHDDELGVETLPESFVEFCQRSIKSTRGEFLYTDPLLTTTSSPRTELEEEASSLDLGEVDEHEIIPLTPKPSTKLVAAIDTSTIKLGELEDGSLCAIRGAIVLLENHRYRYIRYGPLVFSVSSFPTRDDFAQLGIAPALNELNVECLIKRVRDTFERWLQFSINRTVRNAFVLLDGSLAAGTSDNASRELERTLNSARQARNLIIAISKNTKLRIGEKSITNLLDTFKKPCLLDIDAQIVRQFSHSLRFLGRIFVGKLTNSGFPFRIDVDRDAETETVLDGFHELIGTEIVDQGYPETLRIAHILSTFTATDVLGIQAFAAGRYGIQLIPKTVLRRSLFGPFGTGWESWH